MIVLVISLLVLNDGATFLPATSTSCEHRVGHHSAESVTEDEAIQIARQYLVETFGSKIADQREPLVPKRSGQFWIVKSDPHPEMMGGPWIIRIDARTGCIAHVEIHK